MIDTALNGAVEALMREVSETVILPRYRSLSGHEVFGKGADDVVTIADHESEAILTERLAALLPGSTVVGEEAVAADPAVMERLKHQLCWIVDPLDGTRNFAEGKPPFGMLIALADKGETLGGWILDCLSGRFCRASLGGGAFVDGEQVRARTTGQTPAVAAISLIFLDPAEREKMREHVGPHYTLVDIPRCAAEQYPRLVLGQNDIAVFNRALPWDHAAGALFLNEAGGKVARIDGTPYRVDEFERPGLVGASHPALFEAMEQRLRAMDAASG